MSIHVKSRDFIVDETPHAGHRLAAAGFVSIPGAAVLTATLWAATSTSTSATELWLAATLILIGLLPFSLTIQHMRDTAMAQRMKLGRITTKLIAFTSIILFGASVSAFGITIGTGISVAQCAVLIMGGGWAVWSALRLTEVEVQ